MGKSLRLVSQNADVVCGMRLELDLFHRQNGVDNCLLSETLPNADQGLPIMPSTEQTNGQWGQHDSRPPIPFGIRDGKLLKNRLRKL